MNILPYSYRLVLAAVDKAGRNRWMLFNCSIETLEEFIATLNEGKMVMGYALWTKTGSDDDGPYYEIKDAKPVAIGKGGILEVTIPTARIVRFEN